MLNKLANLLHLRGAGSRQAVFVVVGDALNVVALLGTSMALARIIAPADMAIFRQVTYLGPLVAGLAELGISGTIYRYYRVFQGPRLQTFLWQVLVFLVAFGALGSLVLLVLAYPLAKSFGNPALAPALMITCGSVLAGLPFMMVRPVLINQDHSLKATLWEAGLSVGAAFALIVPLWRGWSLNPSLVCWMGANALRFVVVWWYVGRPFFRTGLSWDASVTREVWTYLWPLQLSRLPGILMMYFDKVVTSVFMEKRLFAAYSLGARELPFVNAIPFSISSVMLPRMVEASEKGEIDRVCALWRKACLSTALLTYPVAAFCICNARNIIRAMFTDTYVAGAIPFAAYAGITVIRIIDYGSMARAFNLNTITLRVAVYAMCLSLPLSVYLTWLFGIAGISCCLLISTSFVAVFYLWSYVRLLKRRLATFFPVGDLVLMLGLSFAAAGFSATVVGRMLRIDRCSSLVELGLRLGLIAASTALLYGVLILMMRRFTALLRSATVA